MSKRIYFEVTGKKIKEKILDWFRRRDEVTAARYRFSRRVGGSRTRFVSMSSVLGHGSFGITFNKDPDAKLWRYVRPNDGPGYWTPRRSTKAGKELSEQMRKLRTPRYGELSKIIEMEIFKGFFARAPQVHQRGDRLFLCLPDDYKPIRGVKRISDLKYERLTA
jgi:hypothetical protein